MLATDWASPGTLVLARLSDPRARQYWDKEHLLAKKLAADARDPQPKQKCCLDGDILWDIAAIYPPGAQWTDALPPATFFDGPIVKQKEAIEAGLRR